MDSDFLDWELVHGSDTESTDSITSEKKFGSSSVIDDGMILSDHFSVETSDFVTESGNSEEVRVDSSSDHLDVTRSGDTGDGEVRMSDFEASAEEKHVENEVVTELRDGTESDHTEVANERNVEDSERSELLNGVSGVVTELTGGTESDYAEEANERNVEDSEGSELVNGVSEVVNGEEEILSDSGEVEGSEQNTVEVVAANSAVRSSDGSKSGEIVWWKTPFVILKYCAIRIGPVWSVSMAAAVMGLVILGRRLYNMKKKAQRFNLKVTIDDKKMSRSMNQAARLNEMFTEVRRFPVIRPALQSPGAWPALTLR